MLNNEKITKIIARRYIWLPFLMGVLLGIVCFVVFTGYDRMKIEKIADETLDFMQDRVKKYDDYKNNDKVKSLYRLADKTLELDQRLEEKDADQEELVERYMKDQRLDGFDGRRRNEHPRRKGRVFGRRPQQNRGKSPRNSGRKIERA